MSAEQRQITFTETDDGRWSVLVEPDGVTGTGDTAQEALEEAHAKLKKRGQEALQALQNDNIPRAIEAGNEAIEAAEEMIEAYNELQPKDEDEVDSERTDDRTAIEERSPEEIMAELERFHDERDTDEPVFDPSGTDDDIYAREHVKNLKRLTTDRE